MSEHSDKVLATGESNGAPCRTRTCDLLVRSQTLYPTELRARARGNCRAKQPRDSQELLSVSQRMTVVAERIANTAGLPDFALCATSRSHRSPPERLRAEAERPAPQRLRGNTDATTD
jgi:hypothetical protein